MPSQIDYTWFNPLWEHMSPVARHEMYEAMMQVVVRLNNAGTKAMEIIDADPDATSEHPIYTLDWEDGLPNFHDLICEMEARDPRVHIPPVQIKQKGENDGPASD